MNKQKILIFSLSAILFLSLGYIVMGWSEPTSTMPGNYTAPLNTSSSAQSKSGSLTAPIFYDYNNTGYYINPSGTSNVNKIYSSATYSSDSSSTLTTKGYVDSKANTCSCDLSSYATKTYTDELHFTCVTITGWITDSSSSCLCCSSAGTGYLATYWHIPDSLTVSNKLLYTPSDKANCVCKNPNQSMPSGVSQFQVYMRCCKISH
jgi:hypothetical protein